MRNHCPRGDRLPSHRCLGTTIAKPPLPGDDGCQATATPGIYGLGIVVPRPCSMVISVASWLSAFSVRPNVVSASSGLNRWRAIALA